MNVKIVDTTLRDGEQKAGLAFDIAEKLKIAKQLDKLGVYQIEAGIPAMGKLELKNIMSIKALNLKCKISVWSRLRMEDIMKSISCQPDILHISVPVSDLQITKKLRKTRQWIMEELNRCASYVLSRDIPVSIGMEDASRADMYFMFDICRQAENLGVCRIRYADTVGILHPQKTYTDIQYLKSNINTELEFHAHNDFGMAVANSVAALNAGAEYVDTTLGGIGERTGNLAMSQLLRVLNSCYGLFDENIITKTQKTELALAKKYSF